MVKLAVVSIVCAVVLSACGGSGGDSSITGTDDAPPGTQDLSNSDAVLPRAQLRDLNQLYVYRADSPFASVLKQCALAEQASEACTLQSLPFITQSSPESTREDIMNRLLVTHSWMGERFEALLNDAPSIMVPLFGSLTSISIGSTIRPSNYSTIRGAIRIDPSYLWLTNSEKANISIQQDFRTDFGKELQFRSYGSLRLDGQSVLPPTSSLVSYKERTLDDIKMSVYRLWYHELAHAVDFLPDASVSTLDNTLTPIEALHKNRLFYQSPKLYTDLPLYSNVLYGLGQVNYLGDVATDRQKSYTAADVGAEMNNDGAMKFYGYSTIREDFATLFATAMMKLSFDVDYYMAYTSKRTDPDQFNCEELIVGWGVKNRLADPLVSPRSKWVLEQVYGSSASLDQFFANGVGQSIPMTPGLDWCTNLQNEQLAASNLSGRSTMSDSQAWLLEEQKMRQEIAHERLNIAH